MEQFKPNNIKSYNISITGYKALLIFTSLVNGSKTYDEILEDFAQNHYFGEGMCQDTIRIYLNSLKSCGCEFIKHKVSSNFAFTLVKNPFDMNFTNQQLRHLIKLFKVIQSTIDITDLISLNRFFIHLAQYVKDEKLRKKLKNISPLNNIKTSLIQELILYTQNHSDITILYNSPRSGFKNMTINADCLKVHDGKLYICGLCAEYNKYSRFPVYRIVKVISVSMRESVLKSAEEMIVGYRLKYYDNSFELLKNEKLISVNSNSLENQDLNVRKFEMEAYSKQMSDVCSNIENDENFAIIEITSKNIFDIKQRIMSLADNCEVLYPESFRKEIIGALKQMKELYFNEY